MTFSIANDFSLYPGPRKKNQGPHSGESLRVKILRLLRQSDSKIVVDLDGTSGMGSSFLDEAFGGLIKHENYTREELMRRLEFRSTTMPTYLTIIQRSLDKAQAETVH